MQRRRVLRLPPRPPGEVLRLRNGLLVLKIEDSKQLKKPTLEELKQDIVQALALEKFNAELEQARRQAKVELG